MRPLAEFPRRGQAPVPEEPIDARIEPPEVHGDYGDEFYPRVAEVYSKLARRRKGPAAVIADQSGVKITRAHRWIKEARRRGFLPAGKVGKAG